MEDPPPRRAEKQQPDEDLDDRAPGGLAHHCGCSLLGLLVRCVVCVMRNVCNAWTWAIYALTLVIFGTLSLYYGSNCL